MKTNDFVISVNGLASGETSFISNADKEFFAKFENYEVLAADLRVSIVAEKLADRVDFDCNISGTITVPCDRCMSPVAMPVCTGAMLRLKLAPGAAVEDPYEEVFLPQGSDLLDLGQEVYDYSLLALPLQRLHKEGGCDASALACLSDGDPDEAPQATDSPFANLAEMLNNK